jgi:uncharacterized phage protein (TIGR02218 family)
MKTLPAGMQAHLDTGATTLCWCWRVTRTDSVQLGFTDHDKDLTFDGTTFEASSGFTASDLRQSLGLSIDDVDAAGALSSAALEEGDLSAGLYDNAAVEIWRVNWVDTSERVLMMSGSMGEVRRGEVSFTAELRSLAHYLGQEKGRTYQYACDADLGDARCGVNINAAANKGAGTVTAVDAAYYFTASGLGAFDDAWFSGGYVTWSTGANAGRTMEIKQHAQDGATATVVLWRSMPDDVSIGDTFAIYAGCDKTFEACKDKFSNGDNYRGCPHIPGNDYMYDVASESSFATYSGESMFNE